jgi:basic membrane protein A
VLIPGSKSDKGWMESGYDGLQAAEKKLGAKITVKYIENVKFGDMEQVLVALAGKNELVIGVGGQTQASVFKVAPRFPKVKFAIIGGNADPKKPDNVSGYDVRQAEIAFVAGAAAAMLSKTGGVSYVGGLEIPAIKNAGIEFGNGAKFINPKIKYFESYTGDFDDVAKAKEATLAAIAQGADIHYHILNLGLRGMEQAAREKGTHIIGSYTDRCGTDALYVGYSITGIGYMLQYAIDQASAGEWKPGYKAFGLAMGPQASGMVVCNASPEVKKKMLEAEKAIREGKIKVLEG